MEQSHWRNGWKFCYINLDTRSTSTWESLILPRQHVKRGLCDLSCDSYCSLTSLLSSSQPCPKLPWFSLLSSTSSPGCLLLMLSYSRSHLPQEAFSVISWVYFLCALQLSGAPQWHSQWLWGHLAQCSVQGTLNVEWIITVVNMDPALNSWLQNKGKHETSQQASLLAA